MAIIKGRLRPEGSNNYADIIHLETSADQIIGLGLFGTASGTNAYAVTMANVVNLYAGLRVTVKFANANTGASTLNVNALGAKAIVKAGGKALSSGNLKAGGVYTLVYDGTNFTLQGEGASGNATASDLLSGKTATTDVGDIVGTMTNRGAVAGTIAAEGGQYTIPAGYHNGAGKVTATYPSGKASATGTFAVPTTYGGTTRVSGLAFTPSTIIIEHNGYAYDTTTYSLIVYFMIGNSFFRGKGFRYHTTGPDGSYTGSSASAITAVGAGYFDYKGYDNYGVAKTATYIAYE